MVYHILSIEKEEENNTMDLTFLIKNKISDKDLVSIKQNLEKISSEIAEGEISWEKAITSYMPIKKTQKAMELCLMKQLEKPYWDMQTIDKSLFFGISTLEVNEISKPQYYEDPSGNIGYRIFKLLDRTSPHMANLNDDYEFIQQYTLSQKQITTMDGWVTKTAKTTFVSIDPIYNSCNNKSKWIINP